MLAFLSMANEMTVRNPDRFKAAKGFLEIGMACRAAVYGALVPASRFIHLPAAQGTAPAGGQKGLTTGRNPLVEKKKSKYRLYDFTGRGNNEKLGLPVGQAAGVSD